MCELQLLQQIQKCYLSHLHLAHMLLHVICTGGQDPHFFVPLISIFNQLIATNKLSTNKMPA